MYSLWYTITNKLSIEWKSLDPNSAKNYRYYGIKGWLLILYIYVLANFLLSAFSWSDPSPLLDMNVYSGNAVYRKTVEAIYLVLMIPFLVLAPRKHKLTPKVWLWSIWVQFIIATSVISQTLADGPNQYVVGLVIYFVLIALLTWYILNSKRVNATFLRRIPVDEIALLPIAPVNEKRSRSIQKLFWIAVIGFILLIVGFMVFAPEISP